VLTFHSFWNGIIIFGLALTIFDGEMALVREVARHAYTTLIFSNDYFSWQKEYNDYRRDPSGSMANAIWIIMNQYSVDVDEAESMCIEKIKASCQTFCEKKKQLSAKFHLKTVRGSVQVSPGTRDFDHWKSRLEPAHPKVKEKIQRAC
jgi:hypothetical protein